MSDGLTIPVDRYQPGGDIYQRLVSQYGTAQANAIADAAATGDGAQLANAIAVARGDGDQLETSTGAILLEQLETDPLSAPLGAANNVLQNSFVSLLKNPFVLGAIAVGAFFALGGAEVLKKYVKKL